MSKTTIETITDRQIDKLAAEAAQAGDEEMYRLAVAANNGDDEARVACVVAINAAEAQSDPAPAQNTVRNLISESQEHDTIAEAEHTPELEASLLAYCDDHTDLDSDVVEFWGDDESPWRVHLTRSAAEAQSEPARTEDQWWAWHDQSTDRHSPTVEEAAQRCAAWVAGESDDGPETEAQSEESSEETHECVDGETYTFGEWLQACGRERSPEDLRAAWAAGEDPEEYSEAQSESSDRIE